MNKEQKSSHQFLIEDIKEAVDLALSKAASGKDDQEQVQEGIFILYKQQAKIREAKRQKGVDSSSLQAIENKVESAIQELLDSMVNETPELSTTDIKFKKSTNGKDFLGAGSFGKVYKGTLGGKKVAVKIPNSRVTNMDEFVSEVKIMRKVIHPNVVMLIGAVISEDEVVIVSELMSMDLEQFLQSPAYKKTTNADRVKIAKDVALGLNWLHGRNIVHRDLKLGNILLDEHKQAKIADFGFSQIKKKTQQFFHDDVKPKGNILYMAPEVMQLGDFNEKADVYSYGLIMWEIMTGVLWDPPQDYTTAETYKKFICNLKRRPEIPQQVPSMLAKLIESCWAQSPENRPSMVNVISALNEYIVEAKLTDPEARTFWYKHFLNRETAEFDDKVDWNYFSKLLRRSLGLSRQDLSGLHAIACWDWNVSKPKSNQKKVVTIEMFNNITNMFGTFFIKSNVEILKEMKLWVKRSYFHGNIDLDTAHARLRNRDIGHFLIRLSTRRRGYPFTITYITSLRGKEKVENARIKLEKDTDNPGKYRYVTRRHDHDQPKYHASLDDAIQNCGYYLTDPCPKEKVLINY